MKETKKYLKVTKKSIYGRDVKYNTWHPSPGGLKRRVGGD